MKLLLIAFLLLIASIPANACDNGILLRGVGGAPCTVVTPVYVSSTSNTSSNTGGSGATTSSQSFAITSGDTLAFADTGYSSGGSGAKPSISGISVSGGTGSIGSCALLTNSQILSSANSDEGTEQWQCPVTGSGTATIQVTWSATCYYCAFSIIQFQHLNASPDVGIGATANGSSTTASVSTGSSVAGHEYAYVTSCGCGGTASSGPSGWTNVVNSSGLGWYVYYEIAPSSASPVTATITESSSGWNDSIVALTP